MNTTALKIDSYDIKRRQDTISETWSWCLHLTSGISFAGASSSYDKAIQSIQDYAKKVA
jgi:hypothetical protein